MTSRTLRLALLSGATVALLAGCGGGGGGFDPPATPPSNPNEVPPTATASVAAYINYLDTLPRSETTEPLFIDNTSPPTTETAEPLAPT